MSNRQIGITVAILISAWLAWVAWQPPKSAHNVTVVKASVPKNKYAEEELWRIVTKRMVWKEAIASMRDRLYKEGFETRLIVRKEPIELHAFDDPRAFKTQASAERVKAGWEKKKVDAEVLKRGGAFIVGLGRFFLTSYAEQMQERLKRIGKPYHYERRTVVIPAYRFVFKPMTRIEAERAWRKLQNLGIADPIMMRETEYQKAFGKKS